MSDRIAQGEIAFLKPGQLMPDFRLPSSQGTPIQISDYRQRRNLVLAFVGHTDCHTFLAGLAALYPEFAQETAEVLAVVRGTTAKAVALQCEGPLPFPVLADEDGSIHELIGANVRNRAHACQPAVYILDRFNEIYAVAPLDGEPSPPSAASLLEWVQFIELQCPE